MFCSLPATWMDAGIPLLSAVKVSAESEHHCIAAAPVPTTLHVHPGGDAISQDRKDYICSGAKLIDSEIQAAMGSDRHRGFDLLLYRSG